jgi:hypothetical protein
VYSSYCVFITESPDGEIQSDRGVQKLQPAPWVLGTAGSGGLIPRA